VTKKPLITKLSPNQTDIQLNARRCIEAGTNGLAVINTMMGMAIDTRTRKPVIGNVQGGLSGPAIKPIALLKTFQVAEVARPHGVPIIGQGGIVCAPTPSSSCWPAPPPWASAPRCSTTRWYARRSIAASRSISRYDRAITLFRRHGLTVIGVPLEADGPNIDALEKLLTQHKPKLFYVIPDFQNPSGATCSGAKRRAIAEIAKKHELLLLEDAPYRMLRYRGAQEPTLFSLVPERTLHMTSFTKLIAPGVRLGFMMGDAAVLAKIGKVAEDTYISPGYFAHGVTLEWLKAGKLAPQIEKLKALYAPRLDACLAALDKYIPDAVATRPDGGFFLSLTLPQGVSTTDLRAAAAKRNLNLADGLAFFPQGGGERFLRLPFCALTPAQIDEGIRRLAECVRDVRGK
jgi:2-aminoadipate transaminase